MNLTKLFTHYKWAYLEKLSTHFHRSSRDLGVTESIKPKISVHFFHHKELQTMENHPMENKHESTAYLAYKWQ